MCGIAGTIGVGLPSPGRRRAALARLRHRGPDGEGEWMGEVGGMAVSLLHTRLAIVDLDHRADQPFRRDGIVVAFNGEIYNHIELRRTLEALGHTFTTTSDTEVLVEAYRRWGRACVDRFEGMWAFALADRDQGTIWLCRDRFGEKPLFVWRRDGGVVFASEVKAVAELAGEWPSANGEQLRRFLSSGYRALYKRPRTWFEGVEEVPAATSVVLFAAGSAVERYWSLAYRPQEMSAEEAVEGVRSRLTDAVALRLRGDVPVAFCLSGGVDSGALACIAAKTFGTDVHAFSIVDDDPRYDETDTLNHTVAELGCRHTVVRTSAYGFRERLARQVADRDAPVVTISYYVHEFLSEAIGAAGYKVALSGSGADELFTGYYDHYSLWLAEQAESPDFPRLLAEWRQGYGEVVRNPVLQDPTHFVRHPEERGHIYLNRDQFNAMLRQPLDDQLGDAAYSDNLLRNRMLNDLLDEIVPVILREDDSNSMRWSVENRAPFLDRALAEFAYCIPNRHLIGDGMAKWVLREACNGLLPDAVRLDRRKRGFNASIDSVLDRGDPAVRDWLLADGPLFELLDRDAFADFIAGDATDNSVSKFLFAAVSTKLFLETPRRVEASS